MNLCKLHQFVWIIVFLNVAAASPQIESFFPTGSVKNVQQVTARFTTDMVAMGDPRTTSDEKSNPFTIECKPEQKFSTRWADSKNWVLDFTTPLKSGVSCLFKTKYETKDLAGTILQSENEYRFSTSGPAILDVAPLYGSIEPDQYIVLRSDGLINLKSMVSLAYFEVAGMPDKIEIKVIEGKEREDILNVAIKDNWRWNSYRHLILKKPPIPLAQIKELDQFIVIAAKRRFPDGAKVIFHWPAGILSTTGLKVEGAQQFPFNVIKPFEISFSCERTNPSRPCNPILNMSLSFSKRVLMSSLQGTKLIAKDGTIWKPEQIIKWEKQFFPGNIYGPLPLPTNSSDQNQSHQSSDDANFTTFLNFISPFPESTSFQIVLPPNIKDELGRPLVNQNKYPLTVNTDEYSPLIKFPGTFGILEWQAESLLPVSVRNIEKNLDINQLSFEGASLNLNTKNKISEIVSWYQQIQNRLYQYDKRNAPLLNKKNQDSSFQLPKPLGERAFELVGIPLKKPGLHIIEIASPKLGLALTGKGPMYVSTAALVTDLAVHFKKGRESSLVWVTQLSTAKPVADAEVVIVDGKGSELYQGKTDQSGLLAIKEIKYPCAWDEVEKTEKTVDYYYNRCEVFAFAKKQDDFSFVSSEWSKGIETYRFSTPAEYLSKEWGPINIHTIFDRTVGQPGDVIKMKHVLRENTTNGFTLMNKKRLPKRVMIVHQGSQKTFTLPFDYDEKSGSAVGEFTIPKEATLGTYMVYLSNKDEMQKKITDNENDAFDWSSQSTGSFIVSEYRLPLMSATVKILQEPLVKPSELKADLSASYLAGGPAIGLQAKLRASLQHGYFRPSIAGDTGDNDYNYFAKPLKPGIKDHEDYNRPLDSFLDVQDVTLNQEGGLLAVINNIPPIDELKKMIIELEYVDPNGEIKSATKETTLFPADYIIGLKTEGWYAVAGKTKVAGIITNPAGKLIQNYPYVIEAFKTNYLTHRKRLVGGFYSYDSKIEIISLGKVCEGKSNSQGRFVCEPNKLPAGSITLQASVLDEKKRAAYAASNVNIYEENVDRWWTPSDSDRIDLLPEKKQYEPDPQGKAEATLLVQSPFPESTVLVTVEREGVLDSFVTTIKRDHPAIKVPIKGNYAPNVFVSALVIRGRVGDPQPTAIIDLSKPSMKMGIAELKVGHQAHELMVTVKADKTVYLPQEKVQVSVDVKTALGKNLPKDAEIALVAIDESLLSLKENTSWKILEAMMGQRPLSVVTSSGQNQVIGRRHFGSKAKPPGGDGAEGMSAKMGSDNTREEFQPALFWQARIKLDGAGKAKAVIPLNDSLTSFRIVAIATGGVQFFGHGQTNVQSNKDLVIYSGFAPLVREGDDIKNTLTLRNTTAKVMNISLDLSAREIANLTTPLKFELNPHQAKTIDIPVKIPPGIKEVNYLMVAKDSVTKSEDRLKTKIKVLPAVPEQVLQATLFQLDKKQTIPIQQPPDAILNRGGLRIKASATLVAGLAGVKSYMEDYSYSCLEQKISKAIVLEDQKEIKNLIESLPSYMDGNGLLKFFPASRCGSTLLSRYILNILEENKFVLPPSTLKNVIGGLSSALNGQEICQSWWDVHLKDQYSNESKILIMESLSRFQSFSTSTLATVPLNPMIWKTETVVAWYQLLKRQADITDRETHLKQAENILRSRLNFQGSLMNLQGDLDWEAQWRLFSSRDQEALMVFGVALEEPSWASDVGRMARGIVARLKRGVFDTTMANAWSVTKLRRFSQKFESIKIQGETKMEAGEVQTTFNWKKNPSGELQTLSWPKDSVKNVMKVNFSQTSEGKPWMHFETLSAIPLLAPWDMGYAITRKITAIFQQTPQKWSMGDVANIELEVTAKADQSWVVIRDPIPAGASHLGTGLDGSSAILDLAPQTKTINEVRGWPSEYLEKTQAHFISYAGYLPRGRYKIDYRIRLNSVGEFKLPPTRVEAMYSPETFGELPYANWKVEK